MLVALERRGRPAHDGLALEQGQRARIHRLRARRGRSSAGSASAWAPLRLNDCARMTRAAETSSPAVSRRSRNGPASSVASYGCQTVGECNRKCLGRELGRRGCVVLERRRGPCLHECRRAGTLSTSAGRDPEPDTRLRLDHRIRAAGGARARHEHLEALGSCWLLLRPAPRSSSISSSEPVPAGRRSRRKRGQQCPADVHRPSVFPRQRTSSSRRQGDGHVVSLGSRFGVAERRPSGPL